MSTIYLEPVDVCGCGDQGYLTTRTVPVDLIHGVGQVHKVPVYHCRSSLCAEYSLPLEVSRRLDDLAEDMEARNVLDADFSWPFEQEEKEKSSQTQPKSQTEPGSGTDVNHHSLVQAFTLQFANREYEDVRVVLVIPGEAVFFQSTFDETEHYLLRFEPETGKPGIWFTFSKFYQDDPSLDLSLRLEDGSGEYIKELGILALEEVDDSLLDEFGEIL